MPPEQSVLLPVIWLCALRRLTTLPTRSDSYIPARVQLVDTTDAQYWYVYSQKFCKYGYVNKDYLY